MKKTLANIKFGYEVDPPETIHESMEDEGQVRNRNQQNENSNQILTIKDNGRRKIDQTNKIVDTLTKSSKIGEKDQSELMVVEPSREIKATVCYDKNQNLPNIKIFKSKEFTTELFDLLSSYGINPSSTTVSYDGGEIYIDFEYQK